MTRSVELKVAGQSVRVVSSAGDDELQGLAGVINRRLAEMGPSARSQPQSLLLVAMALAHDLEEERERRASLEARTRGLLRSLLGRIDAVVSDGESSEEDLSEATK
jgi:cell division protein ZapA